MYKQTSRNQVNKRLQSSTSINYGQNTSMTLSSVNSTTNCSNNSHFPYNSRINRSIKSPASTYNNLQTHKSAAGNLLAKNGTVICSNPKVRAA